MDTYFAGMLSTDYIPEEHLRKMCDRYFDPHMYAVGGARTIYKKEGFYLLKDEVNLCLERYNKKNNTNYILEEIVKLNAWNYIDLITSTARDAAGTDEPRYFRGVVNSPDEVLLCEIKEDGALGVEMPPEHDEYYDHFSPENQRARRLCLTSDDVDHDYDDLSVGAECGSSGTDEESSTAASIIGSTDVKRGS